MNRGRNTIRRSLGSAVLLSITLSACSTVPPTPVKHRCDPAPGEPNFVLSLQKQLREREKRIDELESQLKVLKLIDEDVEKQRKPSRPPVTLTPIE